MAVAVLAYELYDLVQARTVGRVADANAHSRELLSFERHLHIWIEPAVNRFATIHSWIGLSAGYFYELAHVTITAATLIYLWRRHRSAYSWLRAALVGLSLPALLVYWLWPVAPPRFTVHGLTDILVTNNVLGAAHVHSGRFVNLYAAMPSLHVAWAVWCAAAVVMTSRSRWRHLAWLYPALVTVIVVATANHFVVDAVAGAALALVGVAAVRGPVARRAPIATSG